MSNSTTVTDTMPAIPDHIGAVDPRYASYPKIVRAGTDLVLPDAYLKWYDISRDGIELAELAAESRRFLIAESAAGRLVLEDRLGFLELHHCTTVAFLIVCTWNNYNELWQSVYVKDLETGTALGRVTRENAGHRPMLCVWELAPVWHEREAWLRYVASRRDATARIAYVNDRYEGMC